MRFLFLLSFSFIISFSLFAQTNNSNDYGGTYKLLQLFSHGDFDTMHISYDGNTVLVQDSGTLMIYRKGSDGLYERIQLITLKGVLIRYRSNLSDAYMSMDSSTVVKTTIQPNHSIAGFVRVTLYRKNAEGDYVLSFEREVQYPIPMDNVSEIFASSNGNLVIINMPYKVLEDFPDPEPERFFEEDDNDNDYFSNLGVFGEEIFTLVFDENTGKFTRKQVLARTPYLLTKKQSKKLRFSAIHPDGKFIKTYNEKRETIWKRQKNNTYRETPNYQKDPDYLDYIEKKGTSYEKIFSSYSTNAEERDTATDYHADILAISPRLKEKPGTRYIPTEIIDIWERGKDGSYKKIQTIDNGEPIEQIVISGDGKTIISASENILKAWVRVE